MKDNAYVYKFKQKIISAFAALSLVLNSFLPLASVYAQEVESTPSAQIEEVAPQQSPSPSPEPSVSPTSESSPSATPQPEPGPTPQVLWTESGGAYTTETLRPNSTYNFPPNEKVSLTFTKLPEGSGTVTVREHNVPSTVEEAASKDYEITSTMTDGTFEFDLTLPTDDPSKKVLSSDDGQNYDAVSNETVASSDGVTIKGITHLTHFIVADGTTNFNHPVINEFLADGFNEWVEMYNPTNQPQNITGWSIEDNDPNFGSPFTFPEGSTIPAKGFLAVDITVTLNDSGDTVNFISGDGTLLDSHTYTSNPGSSSIGRSIDGGPTFTTFTTPTRGVSNGTTLNTLYVNGIWDSPSNDGGNTWGFDAFSSIQDAINFAPTGATINVAAGSYNESLTVDKNLALVGDPGDESIGPGENAPTVTSCGKVILVEAFDITISGLILDGQDCGDIVIRLGTDVTGAAVSDNEIRSGYRGIAFGGGNNGAAAASNTVENNYIHSNSTGVRIDSGNNNVIQNNNITGNGEGILISANWSTPNSNQILNNQITANDYGIYSEQSEILTISGNTISDNFYEGIYINYATSTLNITGNTIENNQNGGSSGMYINQITSGNVDISQNSVSNSGQYGIYLWSVDSNSSAAISGNTIQNNPSSGIYLDSSVMNTTITENTIENNGFSSLSTGIVVNNALGNEAHENTISGNGDIEAQNDDNTNAFDATLNWWGTAVFSEIAAKLSGAVTYSPWYTNAERTTQDSFRTGKAIVSFDFNSPSVDGVINDTDHTVTLYVPNGTDMTNLVPSITVSNGATIYPESGATSDFTNAVTYTVTAEDGSAQEYIITVNVVEENETVPDTDGNVTITETNPQAVITSLTQAINLTITSGVTNPTIDYSSLITGGTGTIPQTTINSSLATIAIPASTVTSADPTWNGVIAAPTVTTVTLPADSTLSEAIEIGFATDKLSFDKAVRILLPNKAGKRAGYTRPGTAFTEIISICAVDSQTTGDALAVDGDCKIDVGSDLVIWTKHFTTFASYTQTTNSVSTSSSSTSGGGGGGNSIGSNTAPSCDDAKPGSAPTLLSAVGGVNRVTLNWNKASDPVTYYLVTYGLSSGAQQYGNPNVGGKDTTSYSVSGLSGGGRYYFRVRAGNGCAPGSFSNELSATPGGGFVSGPAAGFAPGVLGAKTKNGEQEIAPSTEQPQTIDIQLEQPQAPVASDNLFSRILGFVASFFKGLFVR